METSSGEESKQRKQEGQFPDAGVPNPNPANDPSLRPAAWLWCPCGGANVPMQLPFWFWGCSDADVGGANAHLPAISSCFPFL